MAKSLNRTTVLPVDSLFSYLNRQQSNGSVLTTVEISAHNYLYSELVKYKVWDKFKEIYTYCGSNMNGVTQKFKFVSGRASALTNMGSMTYASNYIVGQGIRPNGTSQYFKTGLLLSDVGKTGGLMAYQAEDDDTNTPSNKALIGFNITAFVPLACLTTGGLGVSFAWGNTNGLTSISRSGNGRGFFYMQRSSDSNISFYDNTYLSQKDLTQKQTFSSSAECQIFAINGAAFHNKSQGFTAVTDGSLTQEDINNATEIVNNFLIMIGRNTKIQTPLTLNIAYGQSLSIGTGGTTALSVTQPYTNKLLGLAIPTANSGFAISPLVETSVETFQSGAANMFSSLVRVGLPGNATYDYMAASLGIGNASYNILRKTTANYNNVLTFISTIKRVIGLFYVGGIKVDAIFMEHGEADVANSSYSSNVVTWQSDFDTDIKAITGQTNDVIMYFSQPSSWTVTALGGQTTSFSAIGMYTAAKANPTKIILTGAKYDLTYNADGIHLTNHGYRREGERAFGIAHYETKILGVPFKPLQPISITNTGTSFDVLVNVPDAPVTIDSVTVTDPGNLGMELSAGTGGTATISGTPTVLADYNAGTKTQTIRVPYTGTIGTGAKLRHAFTGITTSPAGPTTGPRGCFRSVNTKYTSLNGYNLDHIMVHWEEAVS